MIKAQSKRRRSVNAVTLATFVRCYCSQLIIEVVCPNGRDDHEKAGILDGILRSPARRVGADHAGAGSGFSDLGIGRR